MANYEVTGKYTTNIRKLEPTDPAAAEVFNTILELLYNNSAAVKKLAELPITAERMSGTTNLLDLSKCTPQVISADEDSFGEILDDNNFVLTDYMPCVPGQTIWFPSGNRRRINYYDDKQKLIKTEIRGTYALPGNITAPDNAYYFRTSYGAAEYDGVAGWDSEHAMICVGCESYPDKYIQPGEVVLDWLYGALKPHSITTDKLAPKAVTTAELADMAAGTGQIQDKSITRQKVADVITNYLDLRKCTPERLSHIDGTVTDDSDYFTSPYIEFPQGELFSCPLGENRCICFYDADKQFLSAQTTSEWSDQRDTTAIPEGAKYLRVSYSTSGFDVWNPMLVNGSVYPDKYIKPTGTTLSWLDSNPLQGKKLAVLGDSICALHKSYINTVAYQNNMDFDRAEHNQSVWGSPVARHTYADKPASFVERFSLLRDDVDYLVIHGGANDGFLEIPVGDVTAMDDFTGNIDEYTFCGALESLFRQAQAKYSDSVIVFVLTYKLLNIPNQADYISAARRVCDKYSIPVLDLYGCSGINIGIPAMREKYFMDDTHFNAWGHLRIADMVERFLLDYSTPQPKEHTEDVKQLKSDLSDYIIDSPNTNRLDLSTCESGNIDINTGNVLPTDLLKLSDYIPAQKGNMLYSYMVANNGNVSTISVVRYIFEFDAHKKLLARSDNIPGNPYTVASDGTAYIRMCYAAQNFALTPMLFINTDYKPTKYIKYTPTRKVDIAKESRLLAAENTLNTLSIEKRFNYLAYAMQKILCIGDSLTSGAYYDEAWGEIATPGKSIDQNYPRLLGRMLGAEVTNGGFSGYSASNYFADKLGTFDLSAFDTFIIWLGTNNGLTDTLDVDVEPYTDYNDYATTETGYYCKIIEKIKVENPSCLIVLTKIFASKGNVAVTNAVIDKIAAKYGLLVVDNSDISHTARPDLHCNISNPHFGKAGNLFIANRYIEQIGNYLHDDLLRCEFGITARTN